MDAATMADFARLFGIVRGYQASCAVRTAAELGIADLLDGGARSIDELAAATGAHAPTLYRLLRALASIGVFHEEPERRFGLTAMGGFLRRDDPLSLDPVVRMFCADYEWQVWGDLLHSVRTGENAATHALGVDVWEYRRRHPDDQQVFDAAMRTMSRTTAAAEVAAVDWGVFTTIADVGGGTGTMLAATLGAQPHLRGMLFDQPAVVAGAVPVLQAAGVADRVTIVPGSFFDSVPAGADAYILRRVLHDWRDNECLAILGCIRRVIAPTARLLIIDCVIGPPNQDPLAAFLDLMMLVSAGGRERNETEWRALLAAAGFELKTMTRASVNSHVLVAAPLAA